MTHEYRACNVRKLLSRARALMDEEHRKRFHSHRMVFMVGALLLLLPLASLSVFTGALILAFPVPGIIYGGICAAAAW